MNKIITNLFLMISTSVVYAQHVIPLYDREIPNEKPLSDFLVPLDSIERAAGFLIFHQFPKEKLKKINGKKTGGLLW